jgi:proline dehydrogenase
LVRRLIVSAPFIRNVAWRFVAGEDLPSGLQVVRELNARGIDASLHYVGTHTLDAAQAIAATDVIIDSIRSIRAENLRSHVSVKLTRIGLDIDDRFCTTQLRRVLDAGREAEVFIRLDMEESRYVETTISTFEAMRDEYGPASVGLAIQSYLRHRGSNLQRLMASGSRLRLVKGGYWESPEVAYQAKADVDAAFLADIRCLMAEGTQPAIATHDDQAIAHAREAAVSAGRPLDDYEFQLLYGVRSELLAELVAQGHTVRCYVPFGEQWYAYVLGCVRRLPSDMLRRVRQRVA